MSPRSLNFSSVIRNLFCWLLAPALLVVTPAVFAKKPALSAIVQQVYVDSMNQFFVSLVNQSKKSKTADDFVFKSFGIPEGAKGWAEIKKKLGKIKSPRVYTVKNGVVFKEGSGAGFEIKLTRKLGELKVRILAKPNKHSAFSELLNEINFMPSAEALVWFLAAPVLKGAGGWVVRTVVSRAAAKFALKNAASAAGGCYLGVKLKGSMASSSEKCKEGAVEGVLTFGLGGQAVKSGGGYVAKRVRSAVGKPKTVKPPSQAKKAIEEFRNSSKVIRLSMGTGILAGVLASADSIAILGELDGSERVCRGVGGNYAVYFKVSGARQPNAVYEVSGSRVEINNGDEVKDSLPVTIKALTKYFNSQKKMLEIGHEGAEVMAKAAYQEILQNQSECKELGEGSESRSPEEDEELLKGQR